MYASLFWHVGVYVILSEVVLLWAQLALLYKEKGKVALVLFKFPLKTQEAEYKEGFVYATVCSHHMKTIQEKK